MKNDKGSGFGEPKTPPPKCSARYPPRVGSSTRNTVYRSFHSILLTNYVYFNIIVTYCSSPYLENEKKDIINVFPVLD